MPRHTATQGQMTTSGFDGTAYGAYNATKPNDSIQAVINQMDNFTRLQGEPSGLPTQDDTYTQISWNDGTKTFQIAPVGASFDAWVEGRRFVFAVAQAVDISLVIAEGVWYFYFDNTGTLQGSQTPWDLSTHAPLAALYWDNTNVQSINFVDYRSGIYMPWASQKEVEETEGLKYVRLLDLTGNTTGDGSADAHAQIDVDPGTMYVGDIEIGVTDGAGGGRFEQQLTLPAQLPIFYLDGATPVWRFYAADTFPVELDGGVNRIEYNLNTAGTWSQPPASADGNYVAMWVYGTNDYREPIFAVMGQREDTSLLDAQNNNSPDDLVLPELYPYMKLLYRLIFITDSTFANTPKAALRHILDYRNVLTDTVALHAPTHSAGDSDPVSVENLATGLNAGEAALSDGTGILTARYSAGARVIYTDEDAVAIINAATDGEEFILSEGTHAISSQIAIGNLSRVAIRGCGPDTLLNITYDAGPAIVLTAPMTDFELSNMSITYAPATYVSEFMDLQGAAGAAYTRMTFDRLYFNANPTGTDITSFIRCYHADGANDVNIDTFRVTNSVFSGKLSTLMVMGADGSRAMDDFLISGNIASTTITDDNFIYSETDQADSNMRRWIVSNNNVQNFGRLWFHYSTTLNALREAVCANNTFASVSTATGANTGAITWYTVYLSTIIGNVIDLEGNYGENGIHIGSNCYEILVANNYIHEPDNHGIFCDHTVAGNEGGHNIIGNQIVRPNLGKGIYCETGYGTISGNYVKDPGDDGISINATSTDGVCSCNMIASATIRGIDCAASRWSVVGNFVYDAGGDGIGIGIYSHAVGNYVVQPADDGIVFEDDYVSAIGNTVDMTNDGTIGINIGANNNCAAVGNRVLFPDTYGIYMASGSQALVAANTIEDNVSGPMIRVYGGRCVCVANVCDSPNTFGIELVLYNDAVCACNAILNPTVGIDCSDADYSAIVANAVYSPSSHGISLDANSDHNAIVGNTVRNGSDHGIYCLGEWCTINANVIEQCTDSGIYINDSFCVVSSNLIANVGVAGIEATGSATNCVFSSNVIWDLLSGRGIQTAGRYSLVIGNLIYLAATDGIIVQADDVVVSSNVINNPAASGIEVADGVDRASILGNYIYSAGAHGIYVAYTATATEDLIIKDNLIYDVDGTTQDGIHVEQVSYLTCCDNKIIDTTNNGIEAISCDYGQFNDNHIRSATDIGIHLDECDECCINDNRCYGNDDGIVEDSDCDNNLFDGNHLRGNTTANFTQNGTNATLGTNKTA